MRRIIGILSASAIFALAINHPAKSQTTMQTLLDRTQIEEMVIDYYAQLGRPKTKGFGDSYTDDAELVLGGRSIKGKAAIEALYASIPASTGGKPRPPMNVMLTNPRITVTGDTAHGEFLYTGVQLIAPDKAPVLHEQGREIDEFVKVNGTWKIKKRTIINDASEGMSAAG